MTFYVYFYFFMLLSTLVVRKQHKKNKNKHKKSDKYPHVTVIRSVKTFPYDSHSNWYLSQR